MKRVLAVASGGGHWVQLLRLRPAWDGAHVHYVTTDAGHLPVLLEDAKARGQAQPGFSVIPEANRWQKLRLVRQLIQLSVIIIRVRPNIVVTTGAAPGYFACRLGRMLGTRTIWVDSIANAETLSLSGQQVGKHANLWLTQWPELERPEGPHYRGAVL